MPVTSIVETSGEENEFFRVLGGALNDNPLPPFAVISQYLAPGGGLMTNTEKGFHWMTFSMKREE